MKSTRVVGLLIAAVATLLLAMAVAPAAAKDAPPSRKEVQKWLEDSNDAYIYGKYALCRTLIRQVLEVEPDNLKAWRLEGASSCFLKDREAAMKAFNHLSDPQQQMFLRYVCQYNKINIP